MSRSKNINYGQICVVLVEGKSDKRALENVLSKLFNSVHKKIRVYCFEGDITSSLNSTPSNIETKIISFTNSQLAKNKIKFSDIYRIVHITDLDGCYIDNNCVVFDKGYEEPYYGENEIRTCRAKEIINRNATKSQNIDHLLTVEVLTFGKAQVPYNLYFMSCNLDHVLYNQRNLPHNEKISKAIAFADEFLEAPLTFFGFLRNEDVTIDGSYTESWNFVKKGNNSLKRKTNIDKLL